MEQEQVGNADMAPESNIQETSFGTNDSDDFFSALDTSVNGGIQDDQELIQTTSIHHRALVKFISKAKMLCKRGIVIQAEKLKD